VILFGLQILKMSRSYESILDHIAEYLQFLSNTQSFWFTLKMSYDHGCHLANRFHLGLNEYKVLLIISGLVFYKTEFGFVIKLTAWKNFFVGYLFASYDCAIKFEQKKIDLNAYINGTPLS
jgi:hypothetical protein